MPDLRNLAIWLLLALAVAGWGAGCVERTRAGALTKQLKEARGERDAARRQRDSLAAAVERQKAEAREQLAALTASVLAQQKRIDAAHAAQEKTDATNVSTIAGLRDRLRRERMQRAAEVAGRGDGGAGAAAQAAAGADDRPEGAAAAPGLLPDPEAGADEDAFLADQVNEAYRSCRARLIGEAGPTPAIQPR
jgi:septal ring factor EnvC (AmiA/AmiB activator)